MIETAGISSLTLSPIPAWTVAEGAPRVAGVAHPPGATVGPPGDADHQRAVLAAALDALVAINRPGGRIDLPQRWPASADDLQTEPDENPPIVKAIIRRPWLLRTLITGNIPNSS